MIQKICFSNCGPFSVVFHIKCVKNRNKKRNWECIKRRAGGDSVILKTQF